MKVALFSTSESNGGAATACQRLFNGLSSFTSIKTDYLVKSKQLESNQVIILSPSTKSLRQIESLINQHYISNNRTPVSNTYFSFSYSDINLDKLHQYDLFNLHWVENFISLKNLYEIVKTNKPIVWTMHDMKPFTGGCHFSAGCQKYQSDCSNCPQLITDPHSLTSQTLALKKYIFNNANLTIISPSHWLAKKAHKSSLFKNKKIKVIPNAINIDSFKVINKTEAKSKLGIKEDKIVLLFGSVDHTEKRKGFKELYKAIDSVKEILIENNVLAVFFGKNMDFNFCIEHLNIGYITNKEKLNNIYNASDVFVLPTLEDNFPNTMLESLACKTPVVAFDTGGVSDLISDDTGCLVPKGDIQALSTAIVKFVENSSLRTRCGNNGRQLIEKKYQLKHQARAYQSLFNSIITSPFDYENNNRSIHNHFKYLDNSVNQIYTPLLKHDSLQFSRQFSQLYSHLSKLSLTDKKYIIYGNGSLGKTLIDIMGDQIVTTVDKSSQLISKDIKKNEIYSPQNIKNVAYNYIIISVLGREEEIIDYLVKTIKVERSCIILLNECI